MSQESRRLIGRPTPCDACGEAAMFLSVGVEFASYKGSTEPIAHQMHQCEHCGAELFDPSDMKENRRSWIRFKKQVDGIPLGCEIASMRKSVGLTQKEAGALFGGGPVAFSKYENDDLIPDEAMGNLLRLALRHPSFIVSELRRSDTVQMSMTVKVTGEGATPGARDRVAFTQLREESTRVSRREFDFSAGVTKWVLQ